MVGSIPMRVACYPLAGRVAVLVALYLYEDVGMNHFYVQVVATRRSTGTIRRSVHIVKYGCEGPAQQMERFTEKLVEGFESDWVFNVMQISLHEYVAFLRRLNADEVLA
jgi:beta-lactamase class D